jgi:signal transduction histidine kinase
LRLVAAASRRLVERLVALDTREVPGADASPGGWRELGTLPAKTADAASHGCLGQARRWDLMPAEPIDSLAAELLANRNLLAALAGPAVTLTAEAQGGDKPVRLTGEDLTRVLVNLVKNAAEAMPSGGRIALGLHEFHAGAETAPWLVLAIEDSGPGIPAKALEKVFESGYTSRSCGAPANGGWAGTHRGLGLAITRSIVEAAGGRIHAATRTSPGARFEIELPVRSR